MSAKSKKKSTKCKKPKKSQRGFAIDSETADTLQDRFNKIKSALLSQGEKDKEEASNRRRKRQREQEEEEQEDLFSPEMANNVKKVGALLFADELPSPPAKVTRAAKRAGAPYQHESLDTKLKKARSASPEPAHDVYEDLEHEEKNEREEEEEDEDEGDRTDAPLPEGYNNADEEQPEDGEGDSPADIDSNADALHPGYESEKERAGDYDDDPFAQIVDHYNEFRHDGASSDEDHDGEGDGFTGEREPVKAGSDPAAPNSKTLKPTTSQKPQPNARTQRKPPRQRASYAGRKIYVPPGCATEWTLYGSVVTSDGVQLEPRMYLQTPADATLVFIGKRTALKQRIFAGVLLPSGEVKEMDLLSVHPARGKQRAPATDVDTARERYLLSHSAPAVGDDKQPEGSDGNTGKSLRSTKENTQPNSPEKKKLHHAREASGADPLGVHRMVDFEAQVGAEFTKGAAAAPQQADVAQTPQPSFSPHPAALSSLTSHSAAATAPQWPYAQQCCPHAALPAGPCGCPHCSAPAGLPVAPAYPLLFPPPASAYVPAPYPRVYSAQAVGHLLEGLSYAHLIGGN